MKVKLCEALLLDCYCKFMSHRTVCEALASALLLLGKMLSESPPERWEVHQTEVSVAEEGMVKHIVPGWLQAARMLWPWRRHTQENTVKMKSHWMLQKWDLICWSVQNFLALVFKENIPEQRCVKWLPVGCEENKLLWKRKSLVCSVYNIEEIYD